MTAATATRNTAPTEAEIRQRIASDLRAIDFDALIHDAAAAINYVAPIDRGPAYRGALWDNLRPKEAARLEELLDAVYEADGALRVLLVDRITRAALTFAAEFPDAPRVQP